MAESVNALEFFPASNYPPGLAVSRMIADAHFFAVKNQSKKPDKKWIQNETLSYEKVDNKSSFFPPSTLQ